MTIALKCFRAALALAGALALFACSPTPAPVTNHGEKVLRVVPQSDLEILDPIWTPNTVTQTHGYMIYDTLFGMDANGQIEPQMVENFNMSTDEKIWTFTLRDGLEFHDGKPVTSEDVIASLKRWEQRDTVGQRLMTFVDRWDAVNAKTFRMILKEPFDLALESLGRPTFNTPFIMPKRVADTAADKQIDDTTGSGPFIFKRDEWKPGEKVVYIKNPKYRPRMESASGTAGGKVVKVERVEWIIIKDAQTAVNALAGGEVDMIEGPAFEQYSALKNNRDIQMVDTNTLGSQYFLRFNHLVPPFDNPKVRQAAMSALNQPDFLQTQVGVSGRYHTCFSVYPCDTTYSTTMGMDFLAKPDINHAKQLLAESGYNGTPVVVLLPTDLAVIAKLPNVAAQLLREAGFKVDVQPMDWSTHTSRRNRKDGWNIHLSGIGAALLTDPISNSLLSGACDKAGVGWPCDAELEHLRDAFARAKDDKARKSLAEQVQVRAMAVGTYVPLGEYVRAVAARKTVTGFVIGTIPSVLYWNLEKQ